MFAVSSGFSGTTERNKNSSKIKQTGIAVGSALFFLGILTIGAVVYIRKHNLTFKGKAIRHPLIISDA